MTVTKRQADAVVRAIEKQFAPWINEGDSGPVLLKDWNGHGWAIVWESGSPDSWAVKDPGGDVDEEFGFKIPARREVRGVFTEPINSYTLGLYPA